MKTRLVLCLAVFAAAIPSFALPPPNIPNPRKSKKGFSIKWRQPHTEHAYSPAPSSGMAAAVAISGMVAAGLRMVEEATQTPTVPVIVTTPSSNCEVVLPPELQKPSAPPVIVIPARDRDPRGCRHHGGPRRPDGARGQAPGPDQRPPHGDHVRAVRRHFPFVNSTSTQPQNERFPL